MSRIVKVSFFVMACVLFLLPLSPVQAAQQAKFVLQANVIYPSVFWNFAFLREGKPSQASVIEVAWSDGYTGQNVRKEVLIPQGKETGTVSIVTDKNEILNISVAAKNARNETLGEWSLQVANKGQVQELRIAVPETVSPLILTKEDFVSGSGGK